MRDNNDFVAYDEETNLNEKPNIILIGAAGHQGREYFKILKERCNFKALIDSDYELLKKLYNKVYFYLELTVLIFIYQNLIAIINKLF